jgi:hypothetical protein
MLVFTLFITGWFEFPYTTNRVRKYIHKSIAEFPVIISEPKKSKNRRKYWIIHFVDKPDYIFWVEIHRYYRSISYIGFDINTNFHNIFPYYYLNEFKKTNECMLISELESTVY